MEKKREEKRREEKRREERSEAKKTERQKEKNVGKPANSSGSFCQRSKAIRKWALFVSTVEMKLNMTGSGGLIQVSKVTFWIRACEMETRVCCHQIPSHVH